jgi:RNA polymerase primary sigma factor
VPGRIQRELAEVLRVTRRLAHSLGREPAFDEVADRLARSSEELSELWHLGRDPISLDAPAGLAGEATVSDFVHDPTSPSALDEAIADSTAAETRHALATLSPREEKILRMRFGVGHGEPRTLEEVGRAIGVTRERIRQIEEKALAKLRRPAIRRRLAALMSE